MDFDGVNYKYKDVDLVETIKKIVEKNSVQKSSVRV